MPVFSCVVVVEMTWPRPTATPAPAPEAPAPEAPAPEAPAPEAPSEKALSSVQGARLDEALFSEALQAADDLQGLGSYDHADAHLTADRVDAMLLQSIEEQMDGRSDELSFSATSDASARVDSTGNLDGASIPQHFTSSRADNQIGAHAHRQVTPHRASTADQSNVRHLVCQGCARAGQIICSVAVFALYRLWHEALRALALAPLMIWLGIVCDELVDGTGVRTAQLFLWPLIFWILGRLVAITATIGLLPCFMTLHSHLPLALFLVLSSLSGWPITVLISAIFLIAAPEVEVPLWGCSQVVRAIHSLPQWWAVYYWWLILGMGFGVALGLVRYYVSSSTSHHYMHRTNEAYHAQRVLRKIFYAARTRHHQVRRSSNAQQKWKQTTAPFHLKQNWKQTLSQVGTQAAQPSLQSCLSEGEIASSAGALPQASLPMPNEDMANGNVAPPLLRSASKMSKPAPPLIRAMSSSDKSVTPDLQSTLAEQLRSLAGPLHFGGGLDASSLASARDKAIRCFNMLVQHTELLVKTEDGGADRQEPALLRKELLAWAYSGKSYSATASNALFGTDMVLDKESFVASVERCYKEQRLLHATIASFDSINVMLIRFCMFLWCAAYVDPSTARAPVQPQLCDDAWPLSCAHRCMVLGIFYFLAIGVGFTELLIPLISLLVSALLIVGRAPGDFFSGAAYVLLARPYDIGDRITTSDPGRPSELYSLVVKHIGLFRTHFLTSNGELLYIDNHAMLSKSITNLTRSGPVTLMVRTEVPLAASAAKVTELVDSIRQYIEEKSTDWIAVEVMISAMDYEKGYLTMDIWATSNHPAHEVSKVYGARSALYLFIHAYMHSAGISLAKPLLPIRIEHTQPPNNEMLHTA